MSQRFIVASIRKPLSKDINADLQWFGLSLGLFGERDKEKSCFRIFVALVRATRARHAVTSDELAKLAHLSRGTVIFHLHKLQEAGFVVVEEGKYLLRTDTLSELVTELERDVQRCFSDVRKAAEELDAELGLTKVRRERSLD